MGILSQKKWKICLSLLLILLVLLVLFIVRLFSGFNITYPQEKGERWVCTEPYFVLEFRNKGDTAFLEIDGVLQPVSVGLQGYTFAVFPENFKKSVYYNDRLLTGTWKYKGEKLVFSIDEDFVFDGAYKKLYFSLEE